MKKIPRGLYVFLCKLRNTNKTTYYRKFDNLQIQGNKKKLKYFQQQDIQISSELLFPKLVDRRFYMRTNVQKKIRTKFKKKIEQNEKV